MNEICATFRPPITIFLMSGALAMTSDNEISSFKLFAEASAANSVSSNDSISGAFSQYRRELKCSCHSECLILDVSTECFALDNPPKFSWVSPGLEKFLSPVALILPFLILIL